MDTKNKEITHGFLNNLKFMLREQWGFKKKAFIVPVIHIFSAIAVSLLGIWLPKVVLDSIADSIQPSEFVLIISLLTIALMLLRYISYSTNQILFIDLAEIWNKHFYLNKERKILDMDYSNYISPEGKIKIEKAHSALAKNTSSNMVSFYPNLVELLKSILGLFSFCSVLLLLNPYVVILLFISYGIDGIIALKVQKYEHAQKDNRARIDRELDYIIECSDDNNIAKDIRIFGMFQWINIVKNKFMNEKLNLEKNIELKHLMQRLLSVFLIFLRNGGSYIYLIWKMFNSDMTIGEFTLFFGAITGFGQWLEQIVDRINRLSNANYQVDDYRYLIDTKDKMNSNAGVKLPSKLEPLEIKLENVSYSYEGSNKLILDNICLNIHKGEKLAIVGANGAGKTTLVKAICGLIKPISGHVLINGIDISTFNRDEYYTLVTAVFQNVCLLPISISQNITYESDNEIDMKRLEKCIKLADLKDKIETLPSGIETNLVASVADNGVNLSGGEIQKLALARALYKDAPLIVLDEPTAALDPIAENKMYLKYNELTQNKTSIYISHRLSSTRFCDKIIFIDNGRIIEEGTHDELLAHGGKYFEMFHVQSEYYKSNKEAEDL
ncbi:ABC transporter ATP-binding protein [Anaerocolumna sp. MB42-C2]|uniref:ABC transporter ATP-binding protein n=1 Tax=Anaerocolumna sp. MB42-C2 TaxID=3070997 RepID=UPI0027E146A5|nr:ABC transporter ATP-binding protein [Anaerocolumna sp. MB42-C2]WMJ86428.1 ABC transporter ATP-binding protein [Anaerocolumna sp. MB42-C2]